MNILDVLYQPWAIAPDRLMEIQSIYAAHLRGESIDIDAAEARLGRQLDNQPQGYQVQDGAALIPLRGVMAPRMNLMSQVSGGTSTELFARDVKTALNDPAVQSIVLMVDSPGGAVGGTMAAASAVMTARGVKPIATYSDGTMASAAYWVGSAADRVYLSSGVDQVGSIGVVASHVDVSKREEALGIKTTEIVAGRFKRISSQYGPLSESGRQSIQDQVDYLYSLFVGDVAAQRGVSADKVIADMADGRVFIGQQAVDAGLVDGVTSLNDVITEMNDRAATASRFSASFPSPPRTSMDHNQVAADWAAENPEAAAVLRTEGAASERDRIAAVRAQALPGHEGLIEQLAADGQTTGPDAAVQVIAADRVRQQGIAQARLNAAIDAVPQAAAPALEEPASGSRIQWRDRCTHRRGRPERRRQGLPSGSPRHRLSLRRQGGSIHQRRQLIMAVGETTLLQKAVTLSATATQYRGVLLTGAAVSAAGNGYPCATGGVSGDSVPVVLMGVAICEAGAAITAGALLEFDSAGRYITRSSGAIVGRALSTAAGSGSLFECFVIPN
jgi:capsid assembly protease